MGLKIGAVYDEGNDDYLFEFVGEGNYLGGQKVLVFRELYDDRQLWVYPKEREEWFNFIRERV